MNIGTISYATQSGLGHLAKMFYDEGIINRVMISPHPRYTSHPEWYGPDGYQRVNVDAFLRDLDVIIIFENAFNNWGIVQIAVNRGVRFIFVPMYEWSPLPVPVKPHLVLCPSLLDMQYFEKQYPSKFIPIPAARLPFKERTIAYVFLHNAGHGQVQYGKGTPEVLEAFDKYIKTGAQLICRGQIQEPRVRQILEKYKNRPNIRIEASELQYEKLFEEGDVYINAEKVNGLSLPLQEAFASGMPVITTNRFPTNTWLPKEMLFEPASTRTNRLNQTDVEWCEIDPKKIAEMVDYWFGKDIMNLSYEGRRWAQENSWERLKPAYERTIQNVIRGLPVES